MVEFADEIDEKNQQSSANNEETFGDAKRVSPPPLLPKASSENLRVEFGQQEDAPENDDNSTMAMAEKLELLSGVGGRVCSANASTSSSSGQLAAAAAASSALPPRSHSSSGKSSTALATKKRGTSGSRSGTSSAKQVGSSHQLTFNLYPAANIFSLLGPRIGYQRIPSPMP